MKRRAFLMKTSPLVAIALSPLPLIPLLSSPDLPGVGSTSFYLQLEEDWRTLMAKAYDEIFLLQRKREDELMRLYGPSTGQRIKRIWSDGSSVEMVYNHSFDGPSKWYTHWKIIPTDFAEHTPMIDKACSEIKTKLLQK